MLKQLTKGLSAVALAAALLFPVAPEPAQASATHLDGNLVQTVQFYPYSPYHGPRFHRPGFYGRGFYGPGFHRRGFHGPAFYGRGLHGPGFYGRGFHGYRRYGGFYGHRFYR